MYQSQSPSESPWQDDKAYREYHMKRSKETGPRIVKLRPPSTLNLKSNRRDVVLLSSIRFKTMTVLGVLFLLLMAICLAVLVTAFLLSFNSVEQTYSVEAAKRTTRAYFDDFQSLTSKLSEYGAFNDTVDAVMATNSSFTEKYMDTYLNCNYQLASKLNFAILYKKDGTLLAFRACFRGISLDNLPEEFNDLSRNELGARLLRNVDAPSTRHVGFFSPFKDLPNLVNSYEKKQAIMANMTETELLSYIILMSGMPIQDNYDYNTKTYGLIVFARFDLAEYKQDMANRVQLCITLFNMEYWRHRYLLAIALSGESAPESSSYIFKQNHEWINTYLTERVGDWKTTLINGSSSVTKWKDNMAQLNQPLFVDQQNNLYPITENRYCADIEDDGNAYGSRMATFQKYYDISRNDSIIIRTDFARRVFVLGTNSFIITWAVMTTMILLLSFAIMVFLEVVVIKRVMNFAKSVREITISNNFKKRVKCMGKDELGLLTDDVNNMLETLDESQTVIVSENERIQELLEKTSLSEQHARVIMNAISDFIFTVDCKSGEIATFNTIFETKILKKNTLAISNYLLVSDLAAETDQFLGLFESLSYNTNSRKDALLSTALGNKLPVSLSSTRVTIIQNEEMIEVYVIVARNMKEQHELMASIKQQQETIQSFEFEKIMSKKSSKELFRVSYS